MRPRLLALEDREIPSELFRCAFSLFSSRVLERFESAPFLRLYPSHFSFLIELECSAAQSFLLCLRTFNYNDYGEERETSLEGREHFSSVTDPTINRL